MSEVIVYKVNAFTDNGQGGNGAGVVLDADLLTTEQMQAIGRLVGYSETAFVQQLADDQFRFRFFSPTAEVDLCGHGTIATSATLLRQGKLPENLNQFTVTTNVGDLSIEVQADGKISLKMDEPVFEEQLDATAIAKILGISKEAITDTGLQPQVVSVGTRQLIVPITSMGILDTFSPNIPVMTEFSIKQNTMGMHVFTPTDIPDGSDAACRSFDPKHGIDEESATGGACGALGYYLARYGSMKDEYVFLQGLNMPNPSKLYVAVKPNGKVQVGGFTAETGKETYHV